MVFGGTHAAFLKSSYCRFMFMPHLLVFTSDPL